MTDLEDKVYDVHKEYALLEELGLKDEVSKLLELYHSNRVRIDGQYIIANKLKLLIQEAEEKTGYEFAFVRLLYINEIR